MRHLLLTSDGTTEGTCLKDADTGEMLTAPGTVALEIKMTGTLAQPYIVAPPPPPPPPPYPGRQPVTGGSANLFPNGINIVTGGWQCARGAFVNASAAPMAIGDVGTLDVSAYSPIGGAAQVTSPSFPVTAGTWYWVSFRMRASAGGALLIPGISLCDANNHFVKNLTGNSSFFSVAQTGDAEEGTIVFQGEPNLPYARLYFTRLNKGDLTGTLEVGHVQVHDHPYFEDPVAVKRPFTSAAVSIDALSNVSAPPPGGGAPAPMFPIAVYQSIQESYPRYAALGFNTVMFGQAALNIIQEAQAAGMWACSEVGQYLDPTHSLYQKWTDLQAKIAAILADPAAAALLFYYFDNERWGNVSGAATLAAAVRAADPTHPLYTLMGSWGTQRQIAASSDLFGTYAVPPFVPALADRLPQQPTPWGMVVLSGITDPVQLKVTVWEALIHGAKGLSFFEDPLEYTTTRIFDIPSAAVMPALFSEVQQLLPIWRQPHWTPWSAACTDPNLVLGTREKDGAPYVALVNAGAATANFTIQLAGLSDPGSGIAAPPAAFVNALNNAGVALVSNSAFSVTLNPGDHYCLKGVS